MSDWQLWITSRRQRPNRKDRNLVYRRARPQFSVPQRPADQGIQSRVDAINALEPEIVALSDEALKARTAEFASARRRQDA